MRNRPRSVAGRPVSSAQDFLNAEGRASIGEKVRIDYLRNERKRTVSITISEVHELNGGSLDPRLDGALFTEVPASERSAGVLLAELERRSRLAYEGMRPGDIITGVNGQRITSLDELELPYAWYDAEDIRNRLIYVEASRGCPFKCEFCLSSLDKTAKPFELKRFLDAMDDLYQRGARNFKFIDRTFNLKVSTSIAILEFFLERMDDDLYLHFEVIPDHLPLKLKQVLTLFPTASLQFEIGVQTFDPEIQQTISRKQSNKNTCANLQWLRTNTGAHIHADLIFGLPGDTLDNFARSFDQLVGLNPQEIQLGILKRLRGAPINRHTEAFQLRYNPVAPYNILSTRDIDFATMQRVNRFARFWDMIGNSGRFGNTLPLLLAQRPFANFLELSDCLYQIAGSSWKISLRRLFALLFIALTEQLKLRPDQVRQVLAADYKLSGQKGVINFDRPRLEVVSSLGVANKRQRQHERANG